MKRTIAALACSLLGAVAAEAGPLYTCPNNADGCAGQTFAMWIAGSGVNGFGQYFEVAVSIDTAGYTGLETHLAHGVELKNVTDAGGNAANAYANFALIGAPGGLSNWTAHTGQLNPGQDCAGGSKGDTGCAAWSAPPGGYDFLIGDVLTWTFRFNAAALGNDIGHLKYYYTDGTTNGSGAYKLVAGLLSQDLPLQDCRNGLCDELEQFPDPVPEPATLLLLSGGLAALAARRRRRASTALPTIPLL
jgi:hypothetical protein